MNIEENLQVLNLETGEVVEKNKKFPYKKELNKKIVDKMLTQAKDKGDIDTNMLYSWCRITKIINKYGQVQIFGNKLDDNIEDLLLEEGIICSYVLKAIKTAHPFSCILKKNNKEFISNWSELYKRIDCNGRREQIRVKKFLIENGLIKVFKLNLGKEEVFRRLILNPYLYKKASHSGQLACIVWQQYAKEGVNVHTYAYKWLQGMGYIR